MSGLFGTNLFHIAHVGTNLDAMVDNMLQSGIGPWFYARDLNLNSRYRGEQHDLVISVAFGFTGHLMFELVVQDNDVPSSFSEYLDRRPEGGLHHIAWMSDNLEASIAAAEAKSGKKLVKVQEFLMADGNPSEIYMETEGATDPILMQIVLPSPWDDAFAKVRDIAANWDGSEPRRNMFDLLPDSLLTALAEGHPA